MSRGMVEGNVETMEGRIFEMLRGGKSFEQANYFFSSHVAIEEERKRLRLLADLSLDGSVH